MTGFITKRDLIDRDELIEILKSESENFNPKKFDWKMLNKSFIQKHYPLKKEIDSAKCIKTNFVDNLVLLSIRKSILNEKYLSFDDLTVGHIVKCKVIGKYKL
jgi:hypothetical protein